MSIYLSYKSVYLSLSLISLPLCFLFSVTLPLNLNNTHTHKYRLPLKKHIYTDMNLHSNLPMHVKNNTQVVDLICIVHVFPRIYDTASFSYTHTHTCKHGHTHTHMYVSMHVYKCMRATVNPGKFSFLTVFLFLCPISIL